METLTRTIYKVDGDLEFFRGITDQTYVQQFCTLSSILHNQSLIWSIKKVCICHENSEELFYQLNMWMFTTDISTILARNKHF